MKALFNASRFGRDIRIRLDERGLSYRQASKLIGVPLSTLNRVANGTPPDVENYLRIVRWLSATQS